MTRTLALVMLFALCLARPAHAIDSQRAHAPNAIKATASAAPSAKDIFDDAVRYEHGEGVEQDYAHALALYCEAAALNQPDAYFNLGWMFLNGRGVPRNDAVAAIWLAKAAQSGIAQALNILHVLGQTQAMSAIPDGCPDAIGPGGTILVPRKVQQLVASAAQDMGVNPRLVLAVIAVESAFNPLAVSPKNAQGLMQLLPETAVRFGVRDPFDEAQNVRGGVRYLRDLLVRFDGNLTLALAAYNAGEGVVIDKGGVPPYTETQDYVERVTHLCACSDSPFTMSAH